MNYPQYRKYKNNSSYFKILSKDEFEEIKLEVKTWKIYIFKAQILPDRNYIYDMIFDYHKHWELITEKEFENLKKSMLTP